jgi:ribosomal protein L10
MPNAVNQKFVTDFTEELKSSSHVVVAEYAGLTTVELNEVRAKLTPFGSHAAPHTPLSRNPPPNRP